MWTSWGWNMLTGQGSRGLTSHKCENLPKKNWLNQLVIFGVFFPYCYWEIGLSSNQQALTVYSGPRICKREQRQPLEKEKKKNLDTVLPLALEKAWFCEGIQSWKSQKTLFKPRHTSLLLGTVQCWTTHEPRFISTFIIYLLNKTVNIANKATHSTCQWVLNKPRLHLPSVMCLQCLTKCKNK